MMSVIVLPNSLVAFNSFVPSVFLSLKSMVFIAYHGAALTYIINPLIYMF